MANDLDGAPLPAGAVVFRLGKAASTGEMAADAFELSSADKEQSTPRLSVWDESRTTIAQATAMLSKPPSVAGFLPVEEIRKLRPDPESQAILCLEVEWEKALEKDAAGVWVANEKPGHEGHCGIARLNQQLPPGTPDAKKIRKSLSRKLADLANLKLTKIGA